jgi:hypothetical protein
MLLGLLAWGLMNSKIRSRRVKSKTVLLKKARKASRYQRLLIRKREVYCVKVGGCRVWELGC